MAEDAWNTRDPERVAGAYSVDSVWRNRSEFIKGRAEIVAFLARKWAKELDYRLIKELWAWHANRIAVRFAYEWHDEAGQWFRSYGNENWHFDLTQLSASDLANLANTMLSHGQTDRRNDKSLASLLKGSVEKGYIDHSKLGDKVQARIPT